MPLVTAAERQPTWHPFLTVQPASTALAFVIVPPKAMPAVVAGGTLTWSLLCLGESCAQPLSALASAPVSVIDGRKVTFFVDSGGENVATYPASWLTSWAFLTPAVSSLGPPTVDGSSRYVRQPSGPYQGTLGNRFSRAEKETM